MRPRGKCDTLLVWLLSVDQTIFFLKAQCHWGHSFPSCLWPRLNLTELRNSRAQFHISAANFRAPRYSLHRDTTHKRVERPPNGCLQSFAATLSSQVKWCHLYDVINMFFKECHNCPRVSLFHQLHQPEIVSTSAGDARPFRDLKTNHGNLHQDSKLYQSPVKRCQSRSEVLPLKRRAAEFWTNWRCFVEDFFLGVYESRRLAVLHT